MGARVDFPFERDGEHLPAHHRDGVAEGVKGVTAITKGRVGIARERRRIGGRCDGADDFRSGIVVRDGGRCARDFKSAAGEAASAVRVMRRGTLGFSGPRLGWVFPVFGMKLIGYRKGGTAQRASALGFRTNSPRWHTRC